MEYTVLIEHEPGSNYGASVPDLPGCIATGSTREEVEHSIREAIEFHLEGLREDGQPIPQSTTAAIVIKVAA